MKRERVKVSGNIQEKNGYYYTVIRYTDKNGKTKQKWQKTGLPIKGNKTKAKQILQERILAYEQQLNENPKPEIPYFTDWMDAYLTFKKGNIASTTYDAYQDMVELHIKPYFQTKNPLLTELTADDIEDYYQYLLDKGLTPNTVTKHRQLIHGALKRAMRSKYISENVTELAVTPSRVKADIPEPYTVEELRTLIAVTKEDAMHPLIRTAAMFGARRSELAGLKWDSVDLEKGVLHIRAKRTRSRNDDRKVIEEFSNKTKTESSTRSFELTEKQIAFFREIKKQQAYYRNFFGIEYNPDTEDYVFLNEKGYPFKLDYITHHFADLLEKNNLRHIRLHDLRHTCATLLYHDGYNLKDIQNWLGHADYQFTVNTYVHSESKGKIKMAKTMDVFCTPEEAKEV